MKAAVLALAASALAGQAVATVHKRHNAMHARRSEPSSTECGCTTYVKTFYGEPTRE